MHKITVKQKEGSEGRPMAGANCQVLLDNKPLPGVYAVKFEVEAKGIAKVHLSMYGEFEIEGNFTEEQVSLEGVDNESEESTEIEETTGDVESESQES